MVNCAGKNNKSSWTEKGHSQAYVGLVDGFNQTLQGIKSEIRPASAQLCSNKLEITKIITF